MIAEKIAEMALSTFAETAIKKLGERLLPRDEGVRVQGTKDLKTQLLRHGRSIERWANEISFRDLLKSKKFQESFVDLDLVVGPPRQSAKPDKVQYIRVSDLADLRENIILLGDPGAGKTTSLKRIALGLLYGTPGEANAFPILIRLRDTPDEESLAALFLKKMGITLRFDPAIPAEERPELRRKYAIQLAERNSFTVLIDGLDEMKPTARAGVVSELREFLLNGASTHCITTCRTGDYRYHLENTTVLTLQPLIEEQIQEFSHKWLGKNAEWFLADLRKNPHSGSEVRPLNLAHLCAIYEKTGTIPEQPRAVYRKIVRLMLEEWDEQRSVRRYSKYANFQIDRKEEFLQSLAYHLTIKYQRSRFTHYQLEEVYLSIYNTFGLPRDQVTTVIREIESHTGLVVEVEDEAFEFAHKSLQEYLTAAYMLRLPVPPRDTIGKFPNETALVIALSAKPNEYLHALRDTVGTLGASYVEPFARRLEVEKVDFEASPVLGFDVLMLGQGAYTTSQRLGERPDPRAFLHLLEIPALAISVGQVLSQAKFQKEASYVVATVSDPNRSKSVTVRIHPLVLKALADLNNSVRHEWRDLLNYYKL